MDKAPQHGIKPEAIQKPTQFAAALVVCVVVLTGCFLGAALVVSEPPWAAGALFTSAIVIALGGLLAGYRLLTAHRELLQDDAHFAKSQTDKRKALERRVQEQKLQLEQHEQLAEQRLAITLGYFEVVAQQLALRPGEQARLSRALRETMRAGEDRALQEQARQLLINTDEVLSRPQSAEPALMDAVLDRIAISRYAHLNSAYTDLASKDIRSIELASEVQRVAAVVLGQRAAITMPEPPVMVRATAGLLEVVLFEVLSNACDYSPKESPVRIDVSRVPHATLVTVRNALNAGTVVSERWFQQGVRGPDSDNAHPPGQGMGLPLVQKLMALVDGNAAIAQDASGACLTLTFREATADRTPGAGR